MLTALLFALQVVAQDPPHDITMVDPAPLGGAIATPLPNWQRRRMKKYDLPELAGAHQALGSQLIDGNLPKPLIDFVADLGQVKQRISFFEKGLVVVDMTGSGATIRKKVIIPPDALKSYRSFINAKALARVRPESLVVPKDGRRALLRVYADDGTIVQREFDPMSVLPKAVTDQIFPLADLLRVISEDRGVTNTIANYIPQRGDELVADDNTVWRVSDIFAEKVVQLECESQPTTMYVEIHDLYNYFIGKRGAATR